MSENKNIDGIKKLSKDEIKKARKILLDYIGEDQEKKSKPVGDKPKKMDGILSSVNFRKKEKKKKEKLEIEKKEKDTLKQELGISNKDKEEQIIKDNNIGNTFLKVAERSEKKAKKEKARLNAKEKIQNEIKEKIKASKIEEQRKRKIQKELEEKKKKVLEEEHQKKKQTREKERIKEEIEREKKHLEKVKKEKAEKKKREKKEKELELKSKKEKSKKEKKKRIKKKIKLYRHIVYKRVTTILADLSDKKKKILVFLLFLLVVSLFLYLSFVWTILKLHPDNRITRSLASFMPVPALISSGGILEYYDYIDKRNNIIFGLNTSDEKSINKALAIDFVLNNLLEKYGINKNDPNLKEKVETNIVYDTGINSVGIKRINKIKDLIDKGGNFIQVSSKYGDKTDKIDFSDADEASKTFGEGLSGLRVDQISEIIYHKDGYYIFKRFKKDNLFSLSYVYIPSISLEAYLNEQSSKIKIWSLVD